MPKSPKPTPIAIRSLTIRNFKALDSFKLEIPKPRMKHDPDILVMGSKNGVGKTSVLESCALLFLFSIFGDEKYYLPKHKYRDEPVDFSELFIRSGEEKSVIDGLFEIESKKTNAKLAIEKNSGFRMMISADFSRKFHGNETGCPDDYIEDCLGSLAGLNSEPLLFPPLMYFHSYRKVAEGNPELGMMVENRRSLRNAKYRRRYEFSISTFKLEVLKLMMGQANLFENLDEERAGDVLEKLNHLVERYAGGTISKLLPSSDNTVDFRIIPTKGGKSFTFDGLSSGQKEIISTLFLIWYYSRSTPCIVLIDEPELHLNAEWHRDFVKQVHDLAPENQYIIATHSVDIFSSVDEDRRVLLVGNGERA